MRKTKFRVSVGWDWESYLIGLWIAPAWKSVYFNLLCLEITVSWSRRSR